MAELNELFEKLNVKPRPITVKIEKAIRSHPTYWEARVRETAKGGVVFDRVVYNEETPEGEVIFARIREQKEEKRVTEITYSFVDYLTLPFNYVLRAFNQVSIAFQSPYSKKPSPSLSLKQIDKAAEQSKEIADKVVSSLKETDDINPSDIDPPGKEDFSL